MLDEFREQAEVSPFFDEEEETDGMPLQARRQFLGMSPAQRFVIAFMLFAIVFLLSSFCLMVTDKIMLPFL